MFLVEGWRQHLCKCHACLQVYQDNNLAFLTDLTDTVHHYESQVYSPQM
jgi:hypothetical protein